MKSMVRPYWALRSWSRFRIWACTDTSRADTGSSQISSFGSSISERAMQMRWHCPPENWWGRRPRTAPASMPTASRVVSTSACCSSEVPRFQIFRGSATMSPTVRRGFSDELGSWKIICISGRTRRRSAPESSDRTVAVEGDRARGRPGHLHERPTGGRLAGAGLADEAEGLAGQHVEADVGDGVDLEAGGADRGTRPRGARPGAGPRPRVGGGRCRCRPSAPPRSGRGSGARGGGAVRAGRR